MKFIVMAAALIFSAAGIAASEGPGAFNPKIGLIVQGQYANYKRDDRSPQVPGFVLGPETEFRPAGFAIAEAELNIEANIDDAWHGWATIAVANEDGEAVVEAEEIYADTLRLPFGLKLKLGRFFSGIGYHNEKHAHSWDFLDAPLVYRTMLANTYADDGLQLRWVAPHSLLIELGVELMRGSGFPGGGEVGDGVNALAGFARVGGDWGPGGAWQVGLSHLSTEADSRPAGGDDEAGPAFSGNSSLTMLDLIYKWAPSGKASDVNLVVQGEAFYRDESGQLSDQGTITAYAGEQGGLYLQGTLQFRRGWRVGLRYDWLDTDNFVANPASVGLVAVDNANHVQPSRASVMLDWSRSEFSRLRLQFNRDDSRPDGRLDEQLYLQYIFSLGAHPAHGF